MFGLSTWELLIIVAMALIFIGPDQLPKVAKQVGKHLRQVRGAVDKVDTEVRRAVREATAEVEASALAEEEAEAAAERERARLARHPPQPELAGPAGTPPASATPPAEPPTEPPTEIGRTPSRQGPAPGQAAPTTLPTRDWSQVGKTPIEGRVPVARPARPLAAVPDPAPTAAALPAADVAPAVAATTSTDKPAA